MKEEIIISVKDLTKKYKDFEAVKGISFEVKKGEVFGILGPNGAGKTTTLEIIEGLRAATSGEVYLDGIDALKNKFEIKHKIGIQLQSSGFYDKLTLKELVNIFASLYSRKIDYKEILSEVGLLEKEKAKVKELSGGQKQRFSIAAALVNDPLVLFLDEPTTGLDPQARRHLWDLVESIKAKGKTIILTTHYMDEAERLCDRIAIMDGGKIIALDTPDNLIDSLISKGFTKKKQEKAANLEDVFIDLTGKDLREE
jgi:ABC-2 type transport system ATP-binding protein